MTGKGMGGGPIKKRILSIMLTLCMVLTFVPTVAFAKTISSGSCGTNLTWSLYGNGTLTISGTGAMGDWSSNIDVPWYNNCSSIETIVIENGVTSIGDLAFINCTSLESIEIPGSVISINMSAFKSCTSLKSVTIPASVTSIGNDVFNSCTSLTSIVIPNSVTSIGPYTFKDCTSLESVTIPDSVTLIGEEAFDGCTSLESITIPDSVISIESEAFDGCTSLESITIPGSVTSISNSTFNGCTSLKSVTIPASVTSINNNAFNGCTSLTSIEVDDSNTLFSSSDGVLFNKDKTQLIRYPQGNTSTSYSIPGSVTLIGGWAFSGCTSLTSIEIPDSVTSIRYGAFSGCTSLASIFLPDKNNLSIGSSPQAIPNTTSKVKYRHDKIKGEVTITEITLVTGKSGVAIPATICGYDVVAVAESGQSKVGAHTHKGGTANCTAKAKCGLCGKEYGEIAHSLVNIPAKAPTYSEAGYKEHWHCTLCNKYFSDAAGTKEITDIEAWKAGEGKIDKLTAPAPVKSDSVSSDKDGNVSVTIEKSIVTVNGKTEVTVSDSIANTILSKLASSSTKKVIINATTGKNTASKPIAAGPGTSTHVNLPESAVKKLTEIENIEITLVTDNGKVVLDKDTIAAVASKAGNNGQVTLVIETVEQNNNLLKIELEIKTSNGDVTDFNKGNVKVTVAISEVLKGKKPVCVYIDEDGRYHKIGGMLNADGTFTFVIGHFSTYAIMAEEEADTAIAAQQKAESLAALADQKLAARSKLVTMKNGKKAVLITWYNRNGEMMDFDGVEIYRSTKRSSGYGKKPVFVIKSGKSSYYNTAIKSGTRYYYKVRGFVIIDGQKYYTDWSLKAIRTVK